MCWKPRSVNEQESEKETEKEAEQENEQENEHDDEKDEWPSFWLHGGCHQRREYVEEKGCAPEK